MEFDFVRLNVLDGGAEVGRVLDGLEVVDGAPDDLEAVDDPLERLDQLPPGGLHALLEVGELALEAGEERADGGADVDGLDAVEGREVEVGEERVVVGGHGGGGVGGGAGGGRGAAGGGAEGAKRGGGGEEEEGPRPRPRGI